MEIRDEQARDTIETVVLSAAGRLDALSAPLLKRAARDHLLRGKADLVLDLSGVRTIDASGLAAVVSLSRSARAAGGRLVPRGASPEIWRAFEVTGLESVFADAA
ncbi:MAG TPA: STAS domain-containing protein [Chloroflexota bacterium]|nr:STAS domain-containing protein [Chloroflexota bacterium]